MPPGIEAITLRCPDDWHVHLRDGDMLATVVQYTARQFEGSPGDDDYSNDDAPNLAWDAMLRLVERLYPDYKD